MNETYILIAAIALSVGVVLALLALFPFLKKKGFNTNAFLDIASVGVTGADALVEALKAIFPKSGVITIVDKVIDYAKIGVSKAEQLYLINEITGDDRKPEAIKFVYESLELAGIEVTDQVKAIVDGCVEAAVLGLGHSLELETLEGAESFNGENSAQ